MCCKLMPNDDRLLLHSVIPFTVLGRISVCPPYLAVWCSNHLLSYHQTYCTYNSFWLVTQWYMLHLNAEVYPNWEGDREFCDRDRVPLFKGNSTRIPKSKMGKYTGNILYKFIKAVPFLYLYRWNSWIIHKHNIVLSYFPFKLTMNTFY